MIYIDCISRSCHIHPMQGQVQHMLEYRTPTLIIAVGSIDGVLTAGALCYALRKNNEDQPTIVFTQAFQVDKINLSSLPPQKICLVDLAVNSRDESMTSAFVRRLLEAGHEIVAVCDEHNAEDWRRVLEENGVRFDGLSIKPVSQDKCDIKSSGALLLQELGEVDGHFKEVCLAADAADRMDFETPIGEIANKAIKVDIRDDETRLWIARWVSHKIVGYYHNSIPLEIEQKLEAYGLMQSDARAALNHAVVVGGIAHIQVKNKRVDVTDVMRRAYEMAPIVALHFSNDEGDFVSFGRSPKCDIDLLATAKSAGLSPSGFAGKITVQESEADLFVSALK